MRKPWLVYCLLWALSVSALPVVAQDIKPEPSERPINPPAKINPTPTPTPTPTPEPTPSAEEIAAAVNFGNDDGNADGAREGGEYGAERGEPAGRDDGARRGYERCYAREQKRNFDIGFNTALPVAERDAITRGAQDGATDGTQRGRNAGTRDGTDKGDTEGTQQGTQAGATRGAADAERERAEVTSQAANGGGRDGDQRARQTALDKDYPRGREQYRDEQYNQVPRNRESFDLSAAPATGSAQRQSNSFAADNAKLLTPAFGANLSAPELFLRHAPRASAALPDNFRFTPTAEFFNALAQQQDDEEEIRLPEMNSGEPQFKYKGRTRNFRFEQEQAAYNTAYRNAYRTAQRTTFREAFARAYRAAFSPARRRGCERAAGENYRSDYDAGYRQGYDENFQRIYRPAFDRAAQTAYQQIYQPAYDAAFDSALRTARENAFNAERARVYNARKKEIYDAAYAAAFDRSYNQNYPRYRDEQIARGRADEAADFVARPLRITKLTIVETIPDGIYEPGETLRVNAEFRNFAAQAISPREAAFNVKNNYREGVTAKALILPRDIPAQSVVTLNNLAQFSLNEAALNTAAPVRFETRYKNLSSDVRDEMVRARYIASLSVARDTALAEGLPRMARVTVTNDSSLPLEAGALVTVRAADPALELTQTEFRMPALQPRGSHTFEIPLTARADGDALSSALILEFKNQRRLGIFNETVRFAVANEYRVRLLTTNLAGLRRAGMLRLEYEITNAGAEAARPEALQLTVRGVGAAREQLRATGFDGATYLPPLRRGQALKFVVPLNISAANEGGELEFELRAAGRAVVIHRARF